MEYIKNQLVVIVKIKKACPALTFGRVSTELLGGKSDQRNTYNKKIIFLKT
jgi:hypothetical protein